MTALSKPCQCMVDAFMILTDKNTVGCKQPVVFHRHNPFKMHAYSILMTNGAD